MVLKHGTQIYVQFIFSQSITPIHPNLLGFLFLLVAATHTPQLEYLEYETGDEYRAYIAFIDEETGKVSDSVYAGALIMQKG